MKIVILDAHATNPGDLSWEGIAALGELTIHDRTPADQILNRIGNAEIILTNKTPITAETIEACPNLQYIGTLATGYNTVDIDAAKKRGIPVCNIPAYSTEAVAQLTFALLLEVCHRVGAHNDAVHAGRWTSSIDFSFWDFPLIELAGKTMGIIGFGRNGQAVARIAKAMCMNVLAYDVNQSENDLAPYVSLDELLEKSDVISLNCPLLPSTEGMINKNTISKMKDGVIIINTARGPIINEQDLATALNNGKVYAAAVDVVSKEPMLPTNPLLGIKNCIITPHIAWAPKEARGRLINIATENIKAFQAGSPINVVW